MPVAIIGAIAAGAAALTGAMGFAQQKKGEQSMSEKSAERGATAYGDLQSQYEQSYGDLEQSLNDQALNQQMALARSGGTAGAQAAGQSAAIAQAPQTATQAGIAAHQGALGYADLANQYRGRQAREDVADFSAVQDSRGRRFGAMGGGLASLGAQMMSDERTKNFNSRVGKDIGFPEAYGDIPVPSDHRMKNMPVSDARAKELEAENKQLKQQAAASPGSQALSSIGAAIGGAQAGAQGGQPGAPQANPWGQLGASIKENYGGEQQPRGKMDFGTGATPDPRAAAYEASLGAGSNVPTGPGAAQAAGMQASAQVQTDRDAAMMAEIQQASQREQLAQDMPGIEQFMRAQGMDVPVQDPNATQFQHPTAAPQQEPMAGYSPGPAAGMPGLLEQQEATRAAGATVGGGPVAQKAQEVAQMSAQQGTTPQEAVRELSREDQMATQAQYSDMEASWHTPDAAAFQDQPRQGTTTLNAREESMPSIPGFSQGPAARDQAYQHSQDLAASAPKVYPDTMAGKGMKAQDDRRAKQELKQQQRSAWLRHVMDPDRESGVKKEGILSDPDNPSDKRSKNYNGANMKASAIFEQTPGSSFTYKEEFQGMPGVDDEQHYGIMAQDLERTPEGATMVEEDEMGLKRVDTDRLSMANSAAINEILGRLRALDNGGTARG